MISVNVNMKNPEHAIRELKRAMQRELIFRTMKMKRHYEPNSVKKIRKYKESLRRRRKLNRKLQEES